MENETTQLLNEAMKEVENAKTKQELFNVNSNYLGKNGKFSGLMKKLKEVLPEERAKMGAILNSAREKIDNAIRNFIKKFETQELENKLKNEKVDITIPVKPYPLGAKHPITETQELLMDFFVKKGFTVKAGTDIETDYYCFEALNVPKNHPARDAQDTFYVNDEIVLRTHTSATQIHTMETCKPPIKMVSTGAAYRVDEIDGRHSPFFHQLEILVVDKNVSMADMKGLLEDIAKFLFGEKTKIRLRPSYFPFTEPSAEADATCPKCGGKGKDCSLCQKTGWIEILGCGMVNPKILRNHDINPNIYGGFAVGIGLERLAMLRYGINDMRELFENDVNFLKQFK